MTSRSSRPDPPTPRPLSNWTIAAGALVVLAVAAVVSLLILRHYGGKEGQVQLDAIRTAGTLVIGTGGAVALLLTARRQRYTELTLVHTSRDATERRITELYTKAAELLGSDQAPARLAGLYALERLAHSTVEHRQTIVDVICAYLRMPYAPPPQQRSYRSSGFTQRRRIRPLSDRLAYTTSTSRGPRHEQAQQELQVRLTAQNILFRNLDRDVWRRLRWWYPIHRYPAWRGIGLNLTAAFLLDFSLSDCQLDYADFTRAEFAGKANFGWAEFLDWASFEGARFTGEVDFQRAQFADRADFGSRYTDFEGARFTGRADFEGARFTHSVNFKFVQFGGGASFPYAQFPRSGSIRLPRWVLFLFGPRADCHFAENWAYFFSLGRRLDLGRGKADFEGARVDSAAAQDAVWPPGWTTRPGKPDNGEDLDFLYLTKVEDAQDK